MDMEDYSHLRGEKHDGENALVDNYKTASPEEEGRALLAKMKHISHLIADVSAFPVSPLSLSPSSFLILKLLNRALSHSLSKSIPS